MIKKKIKCSEFQIIKILYLGTVENGLGNNLLINWDSEKQYKLQKIAKFCNTPSLIYCISNSALEVYNIRYLSLILLMLNSNSLTHNTCLINYAIFLFVLLLKMCKNRPFTFKRTLFCDTIQYWVIFQGHHYFQQSNLFYQGHPYTIWWWLW